MFGREAAPGQWPQRASDSISGPGAHLRPGIPRPAIAVIAIITAFIAAIAARTVIALARGQFFPVPSAQFAAARPADALVAP